MARAKTPRCGAIALALSVGAFSLRVDAQGVVQPLFADSTTLELRLEGPFRELTRERMDEPELPATLTYTASGDREVVLDVQIKPRGISRLKNCRFPPLRLNFRTSTAEGTVFEGQDKLKLVTHCMSSSSYEDYVAREYQIYRLYNALTDHSFRVRWLSIEYHDTDTERPFTAPGFLIEEDWAVAERLGMEVLEVESVAIDELDPSEAALAALFHFMIGNADWSTVRGPAGEPCCHNGRLLGVSGQADGRIVVPYDFDQAAFVDAEHASHNLSLGLRGDARKYRGFCVFNTHLGDAIEKVIGAKEQWLAIANADPASERGRRRGVGYIERGYELITDQRDIERSIIGECRASE